jgi:hypothetical protein
MLRLSYRWAFVAASAIFTAASAQELPREIKGHWKGIVAAGPMSQQFSLAEIQRNGEQTFSAKLTWWTRQSSCVLHAVPITGRVTDTGGLSFSAMTKCDVPFDVQLNRVGGGWEGSGMAQGSIALQLEAK